MFFIINIKNVFDLYNLRLFINVNNRDKFVIDKKMKKH